MTIFYTLIFSVSSFYRTFDIMDREHPDHEEEIIDEEEIDDEEELEDEGGFEDEEDDQSSEDSSEEDDSDLENFLPFDNSEVPGLEIKKQKYKIGT